MNAKYIHEDATLEAVDKLVRPRKPPSPPPAATHTVLELCSGADLFSRASCSDGDVLSVLSSVAATSCMLENT